MDVQLGHQVADGRDVDLRHVKVQLHEAGEDVGLFHQRPAGRGIELEELTGLCLRHEDEPRHRGITVHKEVARTEPAQDVAVLHEPRVQDEAAHPPLPGPSTEMSMRNGRAAVCQAMFSRASSVGASVSP